MKKTLLGAILVWCIAGSAEAGNQFGVYINEVLYNPTGPDAGNQMIEIVNKGSSTVTLTTWSICIQFNYKTFPSGATIPVGGLYRIHVNATGSNTPTEMYTGPYVNINTAADGIGLYHTISGFGTAANMEDYLEFGAGGQPRESVAATALLWTAGMFVPLGVEGQSVAYNGSKTRPHPISDYCNEAPTIGSANTCGSVVPGTLSDLRINEILADPVGTNSGQTRVEIRNTAAGPVNTAGLTICHQSNYFVFPAGSTVPAGGFLILHLNEAGVNSATDAFTGTPFPDLTAADAFCLYLNSADFSNPANMIDFFEWGAAGQSREDVAQAAGLWTSGQFFPAVFPEGRSIQWAGSGSGNIPSEFCADVPTLGLVNHCTSSSVPVPPGPVLLLSQNQPNPFRCITAMSLSVPSAQPLVDVVVYSLSGTPVRRLFHSPSGPGRIDLTWDGRDDAGRDVPAGIYFTVVATQAETSTRKMLLVK